MNSTAVGRLRGDDVTASAQAAECPLRHADRRPTRLDRSDPRHAGRLGCPSLPAEACKVPRTQPAKPMQRSQHANFIFPCDLPAISLALQAGCRCRHERYSAATACSPPCAPGGEQGARTANSVLTTPFTPAGRRFVCLAGLDARPCALQYRRPGSFRPRLQRGTTRAGKWLNLAAGRYQAAVSAALDLTHLPAPPAWGAGYAPTSDRRAWARLPRRRRAAPCLRFPRRLPLRRTDPVGRVQLAGRRLDALPHLPLRFSTLPSGPRLRPRASHRSCAPSACLNNRPAQTAYGRQCRPRRPSATGGFLPDR